MAHFAKVENNIVIEVLVIPENNEANGQSYLNELGFEGTWLQTSYNSKLRGKFAGIGDVYNESLDRFEPAQPYPSWIWNDSFYGYLPPIERPAEGRHYWDEETLTWVEQTNS